MSQGKPGDKQERNSMSTLKKKPLVTMPKSELDDSIAKALTTTM